MRNIFLERVHKFNNNDNISYEKFIEQCESMNNFLSENNNIVWQPDIEILYRKYLENQELLYEGLIKTYPVKSTLDMLDKNGFVAEDIIQSNGCITIMVLYDSEENYNKAKELMNTYGWYEQNIYEVRKLKWIYFLPKFGLNATEYVYKNDMKIYHITNDYYINKILKYGLEPKSAFKIEKNQPDRIYAFIEDPISYDDFITHLHSKMNNNEKIKKLYILEIDLAKCEDKIFYFDNLSFNGVYTHENIPPQCISIKHEINI